MNENNSGTRKIKKSQTKKKSPRQLNCFMLFSIENRKPLQNKYPHLSNIEISSKLGEIWRNCKKEQNNIYKYYSHRAR